MFYRYQFTFLRAAKRSGLWFVTSLGEVYCPQVFVGRMLDTNNNKVVVERQLWSGKNQEINNVLVIVYVGNPIVH